MSGGFFATQGSGSLYFPVPIQWLRRSASFRLRCTAALTVFGWARRQSCVSLLVMADSRMLSKSARAFWRFFSALALAEVIPSNAKANAEKNLQNARALFES